MSNRLKRDERGLHINLPTSELPDKEGMLLRYLMKRGLPKPQAPPSLPKYRPIGQVPAGSEWKRLAEEVGDKGLATILLQRVKGGG